MPTSHKYWNGSRSIKFYFRYKNLTIINCYALTYEAQWKVKETFYQTLKHKMMMVISDMNGKIGLENIGYLDVMASM